MKTLPRDVMNYILKFTDYPTYKNCIEAGFKPLSKKEESDKMFKDQIYMSYSDIEKAYKFFNSSELVGKTDFQLSCSYNNSKCIAEFNNIEYITFSFGTLRDFIEKEDFCIHNYKSCNVKFKFILLSTLTLFEKFLHLPLEQFDTISFSIKQSSIITFVNKNNVKSYDLEDVVRDDRKNNLNITINSIYGMSQYNPINYVLFNNKDLKYFEPKFTLISGAIILFGLFVYLKVRSD